MTITTERAQTFLAQEAALLDSWQTIEWSELFTDDGEYLVPTTGDPYGEQGKSLYLIEDDRLSLGQRALRLQKRTAHAEYPHSRLVHTSSNVLVNGSDAEPVIECAFVVYRSREDKLDIFPGRARYDMRVGEDGELKIRKKTVHLGVEALRPHGALSMII